MKKLLIIVMALFSLSVAKADEGMWLLSLLEKQNINKMNELGFKLTAEDIYSVNKPGIKDAIVGLGSEGRPFRHFCTAEIVSDKGLLITNHHCAFPMIQGHSTVEHDYLSNGFWAYKMEEELTNEGTTASILDHMEDVTERVNALLNDNQTEKERNALIDSISKVIVKEATDNTDFSGHVISMFEGNQFFLFVYTIYKDVRLVGAPPQNMGKFGGDTDNWMWPRHTCDFSMLRIYTGADGRPAKYSKDNIPLKPKHHLPVSIKGIEDNDFAMIMGFPGTTDRFATSFSLKNTMDITNDIRHSVRTTKLNVMKAEMDKSAKTRIQYASKHASVANYWKYSHEQNIALKKLNTMGNKLAIEKDFADWVNADAQRKAVYGNTLAMLKKAYDETAKYQRTQMYLTEALGGPETPMFAYGAGKSIEVLADKATDEATKAKTLKELKERAEAFYKDFDPTVEENLYAALYEIFKNEVAAEQYPEIIQLVQNKYKGDFVKFAAELRKTSVFMDEARFYAFIEKPDMKKLEKDLVAIAGNSYISAMVKIRTQTRSLGDDIVKGNRLFVRGLMEMNPEKAWAPNANSTIRLTYGRVKSYEPRDAVFYNYYTTLAGVMEKEGPKGGEFEVPARLKELYEAKNFGQYGDETLKINFITDNDITGGNSGSPMINANGELIGAAFDGNSEAMSGDIDFEENLQRCIGLDMRYVLFVVEVYAGAKNLIEEMTIVK
ncbi:S46 family peptidase [Odoribacter sp. OttesenSCG-928-J03]|nr:S46 family peptidase [Odoribacter sp. OttesenSCG-928-J03]MDL2283174.1 S46 family peptidase [Odoribacter sp. OttesenSCG-928-G04]